MRLITLELTLTAWTPVHLGNGETYRPDADFVVERTQGQTRVARLIDIDRALLALDDRELANVSRHGNVAAALGDRNRAACTRATLSVRGTGQPTEVRALDRLEDGRAYLPGSALKGSLRTALLRHMARVQPELLSEPWGEGPKDAARAIEQATFEGQIEGRERVQFANQDLNRLIKVSDFLPVRSSESFVSMDIYRLSGTEGRQQPLWCEAIEPGSSFRGTITIETGTGLSSPDSLGDAWDRLARGAAIEHIPPPAAGEWANLDGIVQRWLQYRLSRWWTEGIELLDAEAAAWDSSKPDLSRWLREQRPQFPINVGWGAGWKSKTVGMLLPPQQVQAIADQYGLNTWTKPRSFPGTFPATRKLAMNPDSRLVPPGWLNVSRIAVKPSP